MSAPPIRQLHGKGLPAIALRSLTSLSAGSSHCSHSCPLGGLHKDCLHQIPHWKARNQQQLAECTFRRLLHSLSSWSGQIFSREVAHFGSPSPGFRQREPCFISRSMSMKSRVEDRKKKDLAQKEFKLLRRKTKLMKANMSDEERLIWRLQKAQRKAAVLQQRLKKYELEEDPEPVHDPELITPEQLQALKKIGYKNRNYVPVGRRGVYGGVVQNMHMHWKKHETVQIDCHIFKRQEIRPMARQIVRLSGGIVIDIHQGTTIIMYRGRNYKQPKDEMIPSNTLSKRKALFKSKYLQSLEGINKNMEDIEFELRTLRRKRKETELRSGKNAANHGDEASRFESTKAEELHSQIVEESTEEESEKNEAAAKLREVSSDEDDDLFSWGSDSLDEEDLSDDQYDYKKAEDIHQSRKKEADGKEVKISHGNKMNEGENSLELGKEIGKDTKDAQNSIIKCEENKQLLHSGKSRKVSGQRNISDFNNWGDQKGEGQVAGSGNAIYEEDVDRLKDDVLDGSDDTESDLSEGHTDDDFESRESVGTSYTDHQLPAGQQRKTSINKRQHHSRQGKNVKLDESDKVFDKFSDEEESWEDEELKGFDSGIDEQDSNDDSEGSCHGNRGVMQVKKENEFREDWFDDESDSDGQELEKLHSKPSTAKDKEFRNNFDDKSNIDKKKRKFPHKSSSATNSGRAYQLKGRGD